MFFFCTSLLSRIYHPTTMTLPELWGFLLLRPYVRVCKAESAKNLPSLMSRREPKDDVEGRGGQRENNTSVVLRAPTRVSTAVGEHSGGKPAEGSG
jgi:hypothetical protein